MIPIISVINLAIGAGSIYVATDIYLHIYKHTKNLEYFYFSLMFLSAGMFFIIFGLPGLLVTDLSIIQYDYTFSILFVFLGLASFLSTIELAHTKKSISYVFWILAFLGILDVYLSLPYALPVKVEVWRQFIFYLPQGEKALIYLDGFSAVAMVIIGTLVFLNSYINLGKIGSSRSARNRSLLFVFGGVSLMISGIFLYGWYDHMALWNIWGEALFAAFWLYCFGSAVLKESAA